MNTSRADLSSHETRLLDHLPTALNDIAKSTGLQFRLVAKETQKTKGYAPDAVLTVSTEGRPKIQILVEVKRNLTPENSAHLLNQLNEDSAKIVFVTERLASQSALLLRDRNIQFIDLYGNVYLNLPS